MIHWRIIWELNDMQPLLLMFYDNGYEMQTEPHRRCCLLAGLGPSSNPKVVL